MSAFETVNTGCLSNCQRVVIPPVQMRRGCRALSRVPTGDSDIHSSCEMKDKPAFKPLQGNPAIFQLGILVFIPLEAAISGSYSHTCCRGNPLLEVLVESLLTSSFKSGNQLSPRDNLVCTELSSSCCAEIGAPLDLRRVSQGISGSA